MTNVTKYFEKFREASRHLRNIYYVPESNQDWDTLEDYDVMNEMLFTHLVCAPLNIKFELHSWLNEPASIFKLQSSGTRLPIMINRTADKQSGYWDHKIDMVKPDDLELVFTSYFDWDQQGTIDHRYILCKIIGARESKCVVNHMALVESHYLDIIYEQHS